MEGKVSEIPLKAFNQTDLIAKVNRLNIPYLQLNPTGVCNGLVIDYSRYHLNHPDGDYIAKLKRKFPVETTVSSENFFRRIELYQRKLQNLGTESSNKDLGINILRIMDLLDECSFVQLSFGRMPGGGHTTVIRKIHDKDGNTVGYKLFDPNKGEFDCTTKDNLELNKEDLKRLVQKLSDAYPRLERIYLRNLERAVKKLDITKEASDEKTGDRKYASEYDIFYAIEREDYHTAKILLESNPRLANARDARGKTPLMLIKNLEIASMLLELGAYPYLKDDQGCSSLSNFHILTLLQSRHITLEHIADKHSEIERLANSLRLSSLGPHEIYNDFDKPRVMDDFKDWEGFKKQGPLFKNKIIALLSLGADYDGCAEKSPELTEIIDTIKGDLEVIHSALLNPETPITDDTLALLKNYMGTSPLYMEGLILSCRGPKQSVIMDLFYQALVENDDFESIANRIHFADETVLPIVLNRIFNTILEHSIANLTPFLNACKKADLQRICLPLFSILSEKGLPGLIVNIAFTAVTQRLESHEKKEVAKKAIQCLQAQHLRDSIIKTFIDEDSKTELREFSYQNSCRRIKTGLTESKNSDLDNTTYEKKIPPI